MMKTLILFLALLYVALVLFAFLTADRQIFLPPRPSYSESTFPLLRVETADGVRLAVRYLETPDAEHTILFSHGNAEDLGHLDSFIRRMHEEGFSVLAYDYRGYGLSGQAQATAGGVVRDIEAVYRYAVDSLQLDPRQIILHGRSVGSGPSVQLAADHPVGGLIIESGFTSAYRVITRWGILPFDRFKNARLLADVEAPVLIIHGSKDRIIHPRHGRDLYRAANEPKHYWEVNGAGHNDLSFVAGRDYWARIGAFARSLGR
jgi:abhydrolase domain-containing protein 17